MLYINMAKMARWAAKTNFSQARSIFSLSFALAQFDGTHSQPAGKRNSENIFLYSIFSHGLHTASIQTMADITSNGLPEKLQYTHVFSWWCLATPDHWLFRIIWICIHVAYSRAPCHAHGFEFDFVQNKYLWRLRGQLCRICFNSSSQIAKQLCNDVPAKIWSCNNNMGAEKKMRGEKFSYEVLYYL